MKNLLVGMVFFFGALMFTGVNSQAQVEGVPGEGCFARMVICGGGYNAYHCDGEPTGNRCGRYDVNCFFC